MKLTLKTTFEKGASSWSQQRHSTIMTLLTQFMRYGWTLPDLPTTCNGCQAAFTLQHALECKVGGFRTIQHNEVRDVFAQVFRDAGHTTETEPLLQKLSGEGFDYKSANKDDDARSDIKVTGFWREMRQAYFDIKVVSPYAATPT